MTRKTPWIGTSWKMNKVRREARAFAEALRDSPATRMTAVQPFIIPPFPYIAEVAEILSGTRVKIGAQNMHWDDKGAWTGEVSPAMVKDCGAHLVELGHSERRTHFGETDDTVARKVAAALRHGLVALVCIGDTRSEYEAGATADVLAMQTRFALRDAGKSAVGKVIIAYEPVWSIGEGGVPADPDFANEQHMKLKTLTADIAGEALPILYGGSVNPSNCCELAGKSAIDGLFIGRSAWDAAGYTGIIESVTRSLEEMP
ncbi:MAG: triose-phosphate isomerase [Alphaproteobacteria bacterium]|nr:triose-phosphate isomerase [Alphaproteobacteria bacterium]